MNGFAVAKGTRPFSPTAGVVMTLKLSFETVCVAAMARVILFVPFVFLMVSPAGIPVPLIAWPTRTPVRLDTFVTDVEPEVYVSR